MIGIEDEGHGITGGALTVADVANIPLSRGKLTAKGAVAAQGVSDGALDPAGGIIDAGVSEGTQKMGKETVDLKADTAATASDDFIKQIILFQ